MPAISVIIPTLNEAETIQTMLAHIYQLDNKMELIVADGNSTDETVIKAKSLAKIIHAPRGRGAQMNAGARIASGDILWFLHADCFPHSTSIHAIQQALTNPDIVGGAFDYSINDSRRFFRLVEYLSNSKNHCLNLIYGDMGIFVRKRIFKAIGGYKEIPLMEDMEFCKQLKKMGEIVILPHRIKTSARRWHQDGITKNYIRNWILQLCWGMGAKPEKLAKYYRFGNKSF